VIAQQHPARVEHLLGKTVEVTARSINTPASNAGFKFLSALIFSEANKKQAEHLQQLFAVEGFLNIAFEAARLFIATRTQFDAQAQNEALELVAQLLNNGQAEAFVGGLLARTQEAKFYSPL